MLINCQNPGGFLVLIDCAGIGFGMIRQHQHNFHRFSYSVIYTFASFAALNCHLMIMQWCHRQILVTKSICHVHGIWVPQEVTQGSFHRLNACA